MVVKEEKKGEEEEDTSATSAESYTAKVNVASHN